MKDIFINIIKGEKIGNFRQVAEWSALQTGKCGYPSSILAKVKTFFSEKSRLEKYIANRFELNFNQNEIKIFFTYFLLICYVFNTEFGCI